jgi:hypothetical protein
MMRKSRLSGNEAFGIVAVSQLRERPVKIKLYIDNNVWDELLKNRIDVAKELPIHEYDLYITREAEFEIESMPEEKKSYAKKNIAEANIKTDRIFGFLDLDIPKDDQRHGGFGDKFAPTENSGRFVTISEQKIFRDEKHLVGTKNVKTKLFKNEADVSLAARSANSAILTCDSKKALKRASINSGTVINLREWSVTESLSEFIKHKLDFAGKIG